MPMKQFFAILGVGLASAGLGQEDGIYVCDAGNFQAPPWRILRYGLDGQSPVDFITDSLNWPQDILFLEDSNAVLISNLGSGSIDRYDATTGAYHSVFAAGIAGPTRMRIGPDGSLYVLQWSGNGRVRRYALDGDYLGEFTTVGVPQSIGLEWDADGHLYVSSYSQDLVRHFDEQGNDLGVFINSGLVGPTNIWADSDSTFLVADYDGGAVKRFAADGSSLGVFIGGLGQTEGYAVLPDGSLLLGNGADHSVKRFAPDGSYLEDLIASGSGGLLNPNAIVVRGTPFVGQLENPAAAPLLLVTPTSGTRFTVILDRAGELEGIRVLTVEGSVITSLKGFDWDAGSIARGPYMIEARWRDGSTATRRVVVAGR